MTPPLQTSLHVLNSTQQLIIRVAVALVLIFSGARVVAGTSTVGDFVTMNAYISQVRRHAVASPPNLCSRRRSHQSFAFAQLFAPLSFLGSIYGAIVDAFEDMRNLTDLLRTVHAIAYSPASLH